MNMEFPRGKGTQLGKSWKFQGMGEYHEALGNGKSLRVGVKLKKTSVAWGYGYFLEAHIECS